MPPNVAAATVVPPTFNKVDAAQDVPKYAYKLFVGWSYTKYASYRVFSEIVFVTSVKVHQFLILKVNNHALLPRYIVIKLLPPKMPLVLLSTEKDVTLILTLVVKLAAWDSEGQDDGVIFAILHVVRSRL